MNSLCKVISLGLLLSLFLLIKAEEGEDFSKEKEYIIKCQKHILDREIPNKPVSENPKLSIILPVYNGAKFIKTALTSIQNQNFDDYEIVVIEDFSTDNSLEILEEEAKKDNRIRIFKNDKNYGTLQTKASGVVYSRGKYFLEIDQDDTFTNPNAFSYLYELAEKEQVDMIHFRAFQSPLEKLAVYETVSPKDLNKIITKENNKMRIYMRDITAYVYYWDKLYRREPFAKTLKKLGKKYYSRHMVLHEDIIMNTLAAYSFTKYYGIKNIFYWHNTGNPEAVTHYASTVSKTRLEDYFTDLCDLIMISYKIEEDASIKLCTIGATSSAALYVKAHQDYVQPLANKWKKKCKVACEKMFLSNELQISEGNLKYLRVLCPYVKDKRDL